MSQPGDLETSALPEEPVDAAPAPVKPRSLLRPFNRAGAPSIADLGFDAQPDGEDAADTEKAASADLIGFSGERMPHISFGFEGERWRIRNVIWVIGQSPTGMALIEHTYRAGYRIGFDGMIVTGERLNAACNTTDRVITLDTRANPEQLVNQLAYLLALSSAAIDGVSYDVTLSPAAALQANRLANAYAIGLQLQITFELRTSATLPAAAEKEVYWQLASREHPRLANAYAQTAVNEMAIRQGSAMASVLREFYATPALRDTYDIEVIRFYNSIAPATYKDPKLLAGGFDAAALAYKMTFPATSYAVSHEPKLNLADPANTGANAVIVEAVANLLTLRRNSGVKDRDPWHVNVV